ncbi:hypothetical protein [Streptomyces sp. cg35]|uniref:hypothetical protein n=1 Tax=Streptomyces sp. cg35 TaxID=3421650 RepID=UPI003D187131
MTTTSPQMHWHAFSYQGRGYTDAEVRRGVAPREHPRSEIAQWIGTMPTVQTFTEDEIDKALDWLEGELTAQVPQDAAHYPIKDRVEASRARMCETTMRDVVYGYWSTSKNYCSRGLIACTARH